MARYGQVQPANFLANFMAGRQAADDERAQGQANALRDTQVQRAQSLNALSQNPDATPEQYIRAGDAQTGAALQGSQDRQQATKEAALTHFAQLAQRALATTDPQQRRMIIHQGLQANPSALAALGGDPAKAASELESLPDAELEQRMRAVAQYAPQKAPISVAAGGTLVDPNDPTKPLYTAPNPTATETGRHNRAMEAAASVKAPTSFSLMTPEEVKAAGLPEGTVAQRDQTGKVDVINKRENLSAAEQKTIRDAKMRMPRLNAALRRVDRLGEAVDSIAGNKVFDGGPLDARALQYTKQGQEVNAASAQLMPELQALTRVPGIGSQSDLEARLANLALPSLEMSPEVNKKSQAELKAFIEDLRSAYESIVTGQPPASGAADATSAAPSATNSAAVPTATGPNGQKLFLRNGAWVPK